MKPNTLYNIISYFFIILFLYTGLDKLLEMSSFRNELTYSPFLHPLAGYIFWILPVLEILISILLIVPSWRLVGFYIALILTSIFTIYISGVLIIDDNLTDSCGSMLQDLSPKGHLSFNMACIILTLIAIRAAKKTRLFPSSDGQLWLSTTLMLISIGTIGRMVLSSATAPPMALTGREGKYLPPFDIFLVDSFTHMNTKDIPEGKPFIIIAFSPYCPYSQKEIKDVIQYMHKFENIHIYLITHLPIKHLQNFYTRFELSKYPNITAGVDSKNVFLTYFNWHMVPLTAIYDSKKRLAQGVPGQATANSLLNSLNF